MSQCNLHVSQLHHVFPNTHVGQLNKSIALWLQSIGTFVKKASSPSLCWVTLQEWTRAAAIHQPETMRAHGVHAEGGRSGCAACRWPVPRPHFWPSELSWFDLLLWPEPRPLYRGGGSWRFELISVPKHRSRVPCSGTNWTQPRTVASVINYETKNCARTPSLQLKTGPISSAAFLKKKKKIILSVLHDYAA